MSVKKNTFWNLCGSVIPMLIGLVAIPFILKNIGVERLGVLTLVWTAIGYFSIFDLGLGRALTQQVSKLRASYGDRECHSVVLTGVLLLLVAGFVGTLIILCVLFLLGVDWLNVSESLDVELFYSLVVVAVAVPVTTITSGLKGVLEGLEEFGVVNVYKFILGVANFTAPIVSIISFGPSLFPIVALLAIARFFVLFLYIYSVKKAGYGLTVDGLRSVGINGHTKSLLAFGSWMTLSNLISPLMVVADRFFISSILGAAVVAYYTVPVDFLVRALIIPSALTTAVFPVFVRKIHNKHDRPNMLYYKVLLGVGLLMLPLLLVVLIAGKWGLGVWLGEDFATNSHAVACIITFGVMFNGMAQAPHSLIQAGGNAKLTSVIHLCEFVFYVPVLYWLVTSFGIVGGAAAWSLRALVDLAILHFFARRQLATEVTA